jgi:tetratricopeptide (TPR) repeat protein
MDELSKLNERAQQLFDEGKYKELIELLPDPVLDKFNSADLFVWRSRAHGIHRMEEPDKILYYANKAISIDPKNHLGYKKRGDGWIAKKEYDKAILDLDKSISLKNDHSDTFLNRGIAWYKKSDMDRSFSDFNEAIKLNPKSALAYRNRSISFQERGQILEAIADLSKAIELDPNDAETFTDRGGVFIERGEYDKAFADLDKAIELNPDFAEAFFGRGLAFYNTNSFDAAITDYNRAIAIDENHFAAYVNRGVAWYAKNDYTSAIKDFSRAIELKKDSALAYTNRYSEYEKNYSIAFSWRGQAYEQMNKYAEAIENYEKALALAPKSYSASYRKDALYAKLGIPLKFDSAKADATLYQIVKAVDEIEEENEKLELIKFYKLEIEPVISQIRKYASKIDDDFWKDNLGRTQSKLLAHYCNLKVADLLITKPDAHLRYSNAVFVNDPEEGKILIDFLDFLEEKEKGERKIKEAFTLTSRDERTNFYIGSFLPVKDFHEDELLMWRTYGKAENGNEAGGCCLVIDINFYDEADGKHIAMEADRDKKPSKIIHPLYKVIYYNKRKGIIEGDESGEVTLELEKLKKVLQDLLNKRTIKDLKRNNAIEKILYHSLSELRYFFKSADYFFENELRVIQFATHSDIVKIDSNDSFLPRRMYIESSKEIKPHLKKIILGPKVQHPERWMYLEEQMKRDKYTMEMSFSNCHFQ